MPEQVQTSLSVYLAKKSVGNDAFKESIYFKYVDQNLHTKKKLHIVDTSRSTYQLANVVKERPPNKYIQIAFVYLWTVFPLIVSF